jgi:transcriptional regulator with XRE-family HTH domain
MANIKTTSELILELGAAGYTQAQIAAASIVPQATISRILSGTTPLESTARMIAIAHKRLIRRRPDPTPRRWSKNEQGN